MTIVGDGKQTRDFTNVKDVVDANILAALGHSKEFLGEVLNIGTGRSYSILEISQMIGGKTTHLPERLGEARETLADNSKAKNLMGWEPKVDLKSYLKNLDF
jgi:UDP-glucose 4-epimerase